MHKKKIILAFQIAFCLMISTVGIGQNKSDKGIEDFLITITFNEPPGESLNIYKAPLKYNKDFALVVQMESNSPDLNNIIMPFFKGQNNYPGLYYSEGIQHSDQPFKMDVVQYCYDANGNDIHNFNSNYLNWDELVNLWTGEFGVVSHGFNNPSSSNFSLEVLRSLSYTQRKTLNSVIDGGIQMKTYVMPTDDDANQLGFAKDNYLGVYSNSSVAFDNPVAASLLNNIQGIELKRTPITSSFFDQVKAVADQSSADNPMVASFYAESFSFSGISMNTFLQQMSQIATTYGRDGEDRIWSTSSEELFEYLRLKELIYLNYSMDGNTLRITLSGTGLPENFHYYASTIVVESDAIITNMTVSEPDHISTYRYYDGNALLNLKWNGFVSPDLVEEATQAVEAVENYPNQALGLVAMDKVLMLPENTTQLALKDRLCQLYQINYEDEFCPLPTFLGSDTTVCQGSALNLYAPTEAYQYSWSTGDTERYIRVECLSDTVFWVDATIPGGNVLSDTILVHVIDLPDVNITPREWEIEPESFVTLTATGGETYYWNSGETTPSITVSPMLTTKYIVEGTNEFGCVDTAMATVKVRHSVLADFTYNNVCVGDSSTLIPTINTQDSIYVLEWDLNGDGVFETISDFNALKHAFGSPGNQLVGLRAKTMSGEIDVIYHQILVGSAPLANFEFTSPCLETITEFTDMSIISNGEIDEWFWSFGDGTTSTEQNPTKEYDTEWTFDVTLVVSSLGCSDTISKSVEIQTHPEINVQTADGTTIQNLDDVELPSNRQLVVQVTSPFDQIIWSSGSTSFSVTINETGFYEVEIILNGCTNTRYFYVVDDIDDPDDPNNPDNPVVVDGVMNILTPNGDGHNDYWTIGNLTELGTVKVSIYNRAGRVIYSSNSYNNDWGGTYNNNLLPEGSYFYIIEPTHGEATKGIISILR